MQDCEPPTREPHYFDNQQYGWALRQCGINLISTLSSWCKTPLDFKGSANGRVWHVAGDFTERARLQFTSDQGDGVIELSVHESNWVKVEAVVVGALAFRAWADEPYEEKELWPDGADGVVPKPNGDPPGRISKRGLWLQVDLSRFPDIDGSGLWSVQVPD